MNEQHTYFDGVCRRFTDSLSKDSPSEMTKALGDMVVELSDRMEENPLQTIGAGIALGFVAAKMMNSTGTLLPRLIGRGVGALLVTKFLDRAPSADAQDDSTPAYTH